MRQVPLKLVPAHRKPSPSTDVLYRMYVVEKRSMIEIGKIHGSSSNVAKRWLTEAGIEIRPRGWNTNGFQSEAHRIAFLASNRGETHYNWKGGVSTAGARYRASAEWARLRHEVYERDNWLCQDCGTRCLNTRDSKKYPKRKIQCHHIIPRRNGGPDVPENLVTLCMSCHHKRERAADSALFA